jgi:hypothetical protein
MVADVARLLMGLLVALFHRPIADYILDQEQVLAGLFRSRGLGFPPLPARETVRNIYFVVGIGIALFSLAHLWFARF